MEKTAEDKKYATDNRKFSTAVLADGIHDIFADSPVSDRMTISDLCYRGPGFIGNHGKETKTSWDTLSYTLLQAHNTYQHISSVQEANRRYSTGIIPKMLLDRFDNTNYGQIIQEVFSLCDRDKSKELIRKYSKFWTQLQSGSQGFSGKKTINSLTMFNNLFVDESISGEEAEDLDIEEPVVIE